MEHPREAAAVEGELPCFGCLYDLRGQPVAGLCPECGAAVAESLRDGRWDHADASWRRHVMAGVAMAPLEYLWVLGVIVVSALLRGPDVDMAFIAFGGMGLWAVLSGWLIGSPEPRHAGGASAVRWMSLLAGIMYAAFVTVVLWIEGSALWGIYTLPPAIVALSLVNGLKQAVQLGYVAIVLGRVPGRPLRTAARLCAWAPLVGWWMIGLGTILSTYLSMPSWVLAATGLAALASLLVTVVYEGLAFLALRRSI